MIVQAFSNYKNNQRIEASVYEERKRPHIRLESDMPCDLDVILYDVFNTIYQKNKDYLESDLVIISGDEGDHIMQVKDKTCKLVQISSKADTLIVNSLSDFDFKKELLVDDLEKAIYTGMLFATGLK
ncbi:MAG: hypothetical protein AAB477_03305 [Patescibacteria group bacterium]